MKVEFPIAKAEELPYIVDVYNQSIPSRMATADLEPVSVDDRKEWFKEHDKNRPLWMIKVDGKSAGWVGLEYFYGRPAYEHTAEISIYIDNDFQHLGLGKKAVQHVHEMAPKLGITTILGFIFSHNTPSLALFKHYHYERYAHLPNVAVMDGKNRSLDILGKKI